MKILDYKKTDMSNGFGTRSSIWFSGCDHMCKGCFSKHTWSYDNGRFIDIKPMVERDMTDSKVNRDGISLLGGDPMFIKNRQGLHDFLVWFKSNFPNKTVWLWTGYTKAQCIQDPLMCGILDYVDVLIDGKFDEDKKDIYLIWRGSSNQIIHFLKEV
ncbi:NrdG anaerobic NTP reductase small subunit [Aeromonas phage 65]|uniref:Ribonucleotide reductase of class III (Anaerobic) activating protein n=2 Tax=Ishigurovirus osborne TaxID=260149 RepID=A0A219YCK5_9CAUD|nr:anaerobic ribonucleotide reductase small subunit [Aeromonas phage 65]AAR90896.1 NrdG anaerobic NTP reductase small subunit [Aeromonas phage 65]APU01433.1 ribonucleotide reductase of class III (anaerobic) activating protein [Aeromonas phage 65.2]